MITRSFDHSIVQEIRLTQISSAKKINACPPTYPVKLAERRRKPCEGQSAFKTDTVNIKSRYPVKNTCHK
jgi:hypothetical protein